MPELPDHRRERFMNDYGISRYDAGVLTATRPLADYFEAAVRAGAPAKSTANWISTEVLRWLKHSGKEISECPVSPATLADLLAKVERGEITTASGKKVLATMFETGKSAVEIIAAEGVAQISDRVFDRADRPRDHRQKRRPMWKSIAAGTKACSSFLWGR